MEADHVMAMTCPFAAREDTTDDWCASVESAPRVYRIRLWHFGYERKSFYPSDQRALYARGVVVPVIV